MGMEGEGRSVWAQAQFHLSKRRGMLCLNIGGHAFGQSLSSPSFPLQYMGRTLTTTKTPALERIADPQPRERRNRGWEAVGNEQTRAFHSLQFSPMSILHVSETANTRI